MHLVSKAIISTKIIANENVTVRTRPHWGQQVNNFLNGPCFDLIVSLMILVGSFSQHISVVPAGLDCRAFRKMKGVDKTQVRILVVTRTDKFLAPAKPLKGTL